ncbi:hypothetical protein [Paenibacillus lautus]|jgi:hypothetical protein|uniref:hypothetical protein n=1 Tax=Paenibacillus lautus TaxID=1401 RepID=UPI0013E3A00A|nr:hypothetical protein [Paenibacillus lautus]
MTVVPGDQYCNLFLIYQSQPALMVNQAVWDQTISRLPKGYFIPDFRIINMMMNMA